MNFDYQLHSFPSNVSDKPAYFHQPRCAHLNAPSSSSLSNSVPPWLQQAFFICPASCSVASMSSLEQSICTNGLCSIAVFVRPPSSETKAQTLNRIRTLCLEKLHQSAILIWWYGLEGTLSFQDMDEKWKRAEQMKKSESDSFRVILGEMRGRVWNEPWIWVELISSIKKKNKTKTMPVDYCLPCSSLSPLSSFLPWQGWNWILGVLWVMFWCWICWKYFPLLHILTHSQSTDQHTPQHPSPVTVAHS